MRLALDVAGYHELPGDVRSAFDAWMTDEDLGPFVTEIVLTGEGEAFVTSLAEDPARPGWPLVVDGELVPVAALVTLRSFLPVDPALLGASWMGPS